jgi:hypothetical protein
MNLMTTFSSAVAAAVVVAMATSTGALGACKTTLRGELVQAPDRNRPAYPRTFLFFSLSETTQDNGASPEKRLRQFQSFVLLNSSGTLPISFALDIDSPKDCPRELELSVISLDRDPPVFWFTSWQPPLRGKKTIHLDEFESIPVWGPYF